MKSRIDLVLNAYLLKANKLNTKAIRIAWREKYTEQVKNNIFKPFSAS